MPVSGLVVTFSDDAGARGEARAALAEHPAVEVGPGVDHRVPIVVDTATSEEDRAVWDWLHGLRGVRFVDVVYIHFEEQGRALPAAAFRQSDGPSPPGRARETEP